VPEIRFRPSADLYAKAIRVAEDLGITVTEVALMGLTQILSAREIRLEAQRAPRLRDLPIHGVTVDRIAAIAAAAAHAADFVHVEAGRLWPVGHATIER
jgi:antitoxin component of RelBE/YafQ-DinJ toxin-antitoxin module